MNKTPDSESVRTLGGEHAQEVAIRRLEAFPNGQPEKGRAADVAIREALQVDGSVVLFTENHLWVVLWVFLYWDVIFAKLPGSYDARLGSGFPQRGQDIPHDLFQDSFFQTHRTLYEARRSELEVLNLSEEVVRGRRRSGTAWTRLLEDADRFAPSEVEAVLRTLPGSAVLRVLDRLWHDFKEHRRGLPDLMLLDSPPSLIEVKGPRDRLAPAQADWLRYLSDECGIRCEVLVVGWTDRKVANLRKKLSGEHQTTVSSTPRGSCQDHTTAHHGVGPAEALNAQISLHRTVASVPAGASWADHIKTLRESPIARLACALEYLPLPGAYSEATVALRAIIREKKKCSGDWSAELSKLYSLAAESGFLLDTPYIEGIGPGYHVACTIVDEVRTALEFPYADLGYEHVALLNKTDRRWLVEAWGEPDRHQRPQQLHRSVWDGAVAQCMRDFRERDEQFQREIRRLGAGAVLQVTRGESADSSESTDSGTRRAAVMTGLLSLVILTTVAVVLLRRVGLL